MGMIEKTMDLRFVEKEVEIGEGKRKLRVLQQKVRVAVFNNDFMCFNWHNEWRDIELEVENNSLTAISNSDSIEP